MSAYIMETAQEGERIERKTDRGLTVGQLRWAGLEAGMTVADIGCAAGTTARLMAEVVGPGGRVIGVDASADRIRQARAFGVCAGEIEYLVSDAARIDLPDADVDLCWSRFLFEYLADPVSALEEMVRVTRPDGVVAVSDLDGNCVWYSPTDPCLDALMGRALATLGDGFDPMVGRKLPAWFRAAGLRGVEIDVRLYNLVAGPIGAVAADHWRMKLEGVGAALRERGWSASDARELADRYGAMLSDPGSISYSVLVTVRGTV